MPPRHGKSQFLSYYAPVWYLGTFPDHRVVIASYNSDLAEEFTGKCRDLMEEIGGSYFGATIRPDHRSAGDWQLARTGGGMRAAGIGTSLTGRGANWLHIDDPVKDATDALSETIRNQAWNWYASVANTRIEPGGVMSLCMTPWHSEDLGGQILSVEKGDWTVLRMPGLAEELDPPDPQFRRESYDSLVGLPDPMGRAPGEPLWPERYGVRHFERMEKSDAFWYDALQMCRPRPKGGGMFRRDWFNDKIIDRAPTQVDSCVRWWDRAGTQGAGDYTAGVRMSRVGMSYYVEHIRRGRWAGDTRDRIILEDCRADNIIRPRIVTWQEQEAASAGKDAGVAFMRLLDGFTCETETSTGLKEVRARPFASACERGDVYIVRDEWNRDYIEELASFLNSKHDDQVDASSGAYNKLALGGRDINDYASYSTADDYALVGEVY